MNRKKKVEDITKLVLSLVNYYTIEDFEADVRQFFIDAGWSNDSSQWFRINYVSSYKNKSIQIIRLSDSVVIYRGLVFETWEEAFTECVKHLKNNKDD